MSLTDGWSVLQILWRIASSFIKFPTMPGYQNGGGCDICAAHSLAHISVGLCVGPVCNYCIGCTFSLSWLLKALGAYGQFDLVVISIETLGYDLIYFLSLFFFSFYLVILFLTITNQSCQCWLGKHYNQYSMLGYTWSSSLLHCASIVVPVPTDGCVFILPFIFTNYRPVLEKVCGNLWKRKWFHPCQEQRVIGWS